MIGFAYDLEIKQVLLRGKEWSQTPVLPHIAGLIERAL